MFNTTLITIAISAVLSFFVGLGVAWELQAGTISEIKLEHANERIAIQRANRTQAERHLAQISAAQARSTVRAIQLRTDAAAVGNAGNGLRISTANSVRAVTTDPALCSDTAAAFAELFTDSSTAYAELAEKAERHTIDIQELIARQR